MGSMRVMSESRFRATHADFKTFTLRDESRLMGVMVGDADREEAMGFMAAYRLRPVTHGLLIRSILVDERLMGFFKGNTAWIAGENGIQTNAEFQNVTLSGKLVRRKNLDPERTVMVRNGDNPLFFAVFDDMDMGQARYYVASIRPHYPANLIVGILPDREPLRPSLRR
ncbi:MAG: hypothetical protein KGH72_05315 [Candidatus Micrarchaeota archaeon]|nr:hypothetical protein [Candidatus Micrarchaeota archaeon]